MKHQEIKIISTIMGFLIMLLVTLPLAGSLELSGDNESNSITHPSESSIMNTTNCTNDYCMSDEDYIDLIVAYIVPDICDWFLIAMHSVVFIVGLVGNFLVCLAVYRNHTMRTVTNYYIVNLAVADLLVILFCLPSTVLWDVTETWFLGLQLCKAVPYLQTVSVTVSVMTLTFISIDRWYAICFPLKFKSTPNRAKKAILFIWLAAFIFDIPDAVVLQVFGPKHLKLNTIFFTQCAKSWSSRSETTFIFLKLVLLYFGPLSFMTVAYYQIVRVLWANNIPGRMLPSRVWEKDVNSTSGLGNPADQLRSRRKAAKMLVAVVIMFAICYLPVHLLSILRQTLDVQSNQLTKAFSLLAHWLCYANSAVNPLIYNFMSGKFRKEFKRTFRCPSRNDDPNHGRVAYRSTGSNTSRQRSQMLTKPIHTTIINNVVQQSIEIIPLRTLSHIQKSDKSN